MLPLPIIEGAEGGRRTSGGVGRDGGEAGAPSAEVVEDGSWAGLVVRELRRRWWMAAGVREMWEVVELDRR